MREFQVGDIVRVSKSTSLCHILYYCDTKLRDNKIEGVVQDISVDRLRIIEVIFDDDYNYFHPTQLRLVRRP